MLSIWQKSCYDQRTRAQHCLILTVKRMHSFRRNASKGGKTSIAFVVELWILGTIFLNLQNVCWLFHSCCTISTLIHSLGETLSDETFFSFLSQFYEKKWTVNDNKWTFKSPFVAHFLTSRFTKLYQISSIETQAKTMRISTLKFKFNYMIKTFDCFPLKTVVKYLFNLRRFSSRQSKKILWF